MIALFLMTEKGYRVLEAISEHFPDIIECVVSSQDGDVLNDYYDEIKTFCSEKGIVFLDRKNVSRLRVPMCLPFLGDGLFI